MIKKLKLIHAFKGTCHYPVTDKIGSQCYYSLKCSPHWEAPSEVLFLTYSDIGQIWSEFSLESLGPFYSSWVKQEVNQWLVATLALAFSVRSGPYIS